MTPPAAFWLSYRYISSPLLCVNNHSVIILMISLSVSYIPTLPSLPIFLIVFSTLLRISPSSPESQI